MMNDDMLRLARPSRHIQTASSKEPTDTPQMGKIRGPVQEKCPTRCSKRPATVGYGLPTPHAVWSQPLAQEHASGTIFVWARTVLGILLTLFSSKAGVRGNDPSLSRLDKEKKAGTEIVPPFSQVTVPELIASVKKPAQENQGHGLATSCE